MYKILGDPQTDTYYTALKMGDNWLIQACISDKALNYLIEEHKFDLISEG